VRETCAQVLGVTAIHLHPRSVYNIARRIVQFVTRPEWEVRHGGLLGLKYILAARRVCLMHYRPNFQISQKLTFRISESDALLQVDTLLSPKQRSKGKHTLK